MPTVYTFDSGLKTIVKIVKRGKVWVIYRLKEIKVDRLGNKLFDFETTPYASWHYKPFEDKDVSLTPDPYYEDVKTWCSYHITQILGVFELQERFSLAAFTQQ